MVGPRLPERGGRPLSDRQLSRGAANTFFVGTWLPLFCVLNVCFDLRYSRVLKITQKHSKTLIAKCWSEALDLGPVLLDPWQHLLPTNRNDGRKGRLGAVIFLRHSLPRATTARRPHCSLMELIDAFFNRAHPFAKSAEHFQYNYRKYSIR